MQKILILICLVLITGCSLINEDTYYVQTNSEGIQTTSTTQKVSSGCSLVGKWEQISCATNSGNDIPCMVDLSTVPSAVRTLEFENENTVKMSWKEDAIGPEIKEVKNNNICVAYPNGGEMCFPLSFMDCNTLLYCLAPGSPDGPCEKLNKIN